MKKNFFSIFGNHDPAADGTAFFTAVLFVVFCLLTSQFCAERFGVIFFIPALAAALLLLLVFWLILPHKKHHGSMQTVLWGCSVGAVLVLQSRSVQGYALPLCAALWLGFVFLRYTRKIRLAVLIAFCTAAGLFFGNAIPRFVFSPQERQTERQIGTADDMNLALYQHILVIAAEQGKVPEYYRWMFDAEAGSIPSSLEELIRLVQPQALFLHTEKKEVRDQVDLLDFLYVRVNPEPGRDLSKSYYYSEDFCRRVKILLTPEKGILAYVLPENFTNADRASVLAALRNVFRRTVVFELHGTLVLASDSTDLTGDAAQLDRRASGKLGIYSCFKAPDGLLAYILPLSEEQKMAHELLQADAFIVPPARVNHPVLMHGKFWQYAYMIGDTFYLWTSLILVIYLLLRYFISWKPVHKKAFRSFESGFFSVGCILFCYFAAFNSIGEPQRNTLPGYLLAFTLSLAVQLTWRSHRQPGILTSVLLPVIFLGMIWWHDGPPNMACWFCLAVLAGEIRMAFFRLESDLQPETEPQVLIPMAGLGMLPALLFFPAGFLCDSRQTYGACVLAVMILLFFYRKNIPSLPAEKLENG